MKILHVINSLKNGGAEGNLFRLCVNLKEKYKNKIQITIITLIDNGYYETKLKKLGIKIFSLKFKEEKNFLNIFNKIKILKNLVKKENPDLVQSWMYHSNFMSIFVSQIYKKKIFWNVRHSELNYKISKFTTIVLSLLCGIFSKKVPEKIIYCSNKSINFHEKKHFYFNNKSFLVNNGYDYKEYFYSKNLKNKFRKKNKFKNSDILIGFAGRFAKQKNIYSLLEAFSLLQNQGKNIYLLMAGKGINHQNNFLVNKIKKLKIYKFVFLLDEKKNLLEFYNGIDFLVLPSHSESFPNVIAESMLCSTPVLSSKAGCAEEIVLSKSFIMNKVDKKSISKMLEKIIRLKLNNSFKWREIQKNSRAHIIKQYSVEKMMKNYLDTWTF